MFDEDSYVLNSGALRSATTLMFVCLFAGTDMSTNSFFQRCTVVSIELIMGKWHMFYMSFFKLFSNLEIFFSKNAYFDPLGPFLTCAKRRFYNLLM